MAATNAKSPTIFVTDLPKGLNESQLTDIFNLYGEVKKVKLVSGAASSSTQVLITLGALEDATFLVENLNGNIPQGLEQACSVQYGNPNFGGGASNFGGGIAEVGKRAEPFKSAPRPGVSGTCAGGAHYGWGNGGNAGAWSSGFGGGYGGEMESFLKTLEQSPNMPGSKASGIEFVELFVGGLPPDCSDTWLYRMMAPFGQIGANGLAALKDRDTGMCRGMGFVNFLSAESAQRAISALNNCPLPTGETLRVQMKRAGGGAKGGCKGTA